MNAAAESADEAAIDARQQAAIRKEWAYRLTKGAKDALFNMFHNKSDDFLDLVAAGRITIVGPAMDELYQQYRGFDTDETIDVSPDTLVPAIGYGSTLERLFGGAIRLNDFHLGCIHITHPDLFAVGFARPIIGNIPTISEVQARYICGMIAGKYPRPENIEAAHQADRATRDRRFQHLDLQRIYPVEMFAYCDDLARRMSLYPSRAAAGSLGTWWRMQLAPATTLHYMPPEVSVRDQWKATPVYMPWPFVLILLLLKPVDAIYRAGLKFWPKRAEREKDARPIPTTGNVPQRGSSRA